NAGEKVDVVLRSDPRDLGTVTANSHGTARKSVTLPRGFGAGAHTVTFTGKSSHAVGTYAFTVTIVATLPIGSGNPNDQGNESGHGGGGGDNPSAEGGPNALAFTGVDVLAMVAAGVALLLVGVLLTVGGRRAGFRRRG